MRILFVANSSLGRIGGAAKYYMPAYTAIAGYPTGLIAQAGPSSEGVLEDGNVELFLGDWTNVRDRLAFIRHAVQTFQPDIVHTFFHRYCGLYPSLLKRKAKAPKWVVDIRSPLLKQGWQAHAAVKLNRYEVARYDCIVAHGAESAETVIGPNLDVCVVPPGVEINWLKVRQSPNEEANPLGTSCSRGVYVGSLNAIRSLEGMFHSIRYASRWVPLQLDIYGSGNDLDALKDKVKYEELIETVRFQGKIARRDLYELLADYDFGLAYIGNPLHDAAPPLKTLEYLGAGLPVVATDTIGNRMFVEDDLNGVLTARDSESFGEGIVRLVQSSEFEAMSARARESVAAYDWERIVEERLIPLYQGLLQGSRGSARSA
ncbi:MAG: glycosyltransferase [Salinibacter sp.]